MVDGYCRGCRYLSKLVAGFYCDYLSATGQVRGCRSGVGCVRRELGGHPYSQASLDRAVKAAEKKQRAERHRGDWDVMYEKDRRCKAEAAERCKARCAGRQRAVLMAWLEREKKTKGELGDMIGIAASTIGKWCSERAPANWEKLAAVGIEKPEGL